MKQRDHQRKASCTSVSIQNSAVGESMFCYALRRYKGTVHFSFSHIPLQMLVSSRIFLEEPVLIHLSRKLPVNGRQSLRIMKKR